MITLKQIHSLQTHYNVADSSFNGGEVGFDEYVSQCRVFITNNLPEEYSKGLWDDDKKHDQLVTLTSLFVGEHRVKVKGYVSPEGVIQADQLLEDLIDFITGEAVLREALDDEEVDEIQINDKNTIFVSKGGRLVPYVNKHGKIMQFSNNDEIGIVLSKLIDDGTGNKPQYTEGNPILNAKTFKKQYRVNSVLYNLNARAKAPYDFPVTTAVIRKFKEVSLTMDKMIEYGALTPKMARFLLLIGKAEISPFFVGPTASGKTSLLRAVFSEAPLDRRIILIQNPTEVSFHERDEYGRLIRNVVHHEVWQKAPHTVNAHLGSMAGLMENTLRESPEILIMGEARTPAEFEQVIRAATTGHVVGGTYHAKNSRDALDRFARELLAGSNSGYMENLRLVANKVNIIVTQFRFPDGRRRVMEISEINGVDEKGEPNIRTLFEFQMSGETRENEYGLMEVLGEFKQVGTISEDFAKELFKGAISKQTIAEFMEITESLD